MSRPRANDLPLFTLLLVVDSLHFVFARALLPHITPNASPMYVLVIGTAQVGIFGLIQRRFDLKVLREHIFFFAIVGFLVAVPTVLNFAAVAFIDAGTACMLSKTATLYALGFSFVWLRERLDRMQVVGAALAVIGVFVVTFQPGDYLRLGSAMVLLSAFMYALHAAAVKRYAGDMEFINFFFFRLMFTTGFLFLYAAGSRALVWPTPAAWGLLFLAATVDLSLSRSLYYLALRRLPMSLHSIILTLSPVIAVLWSLVLFNATPAPQQVLGGVAVLTGVFISTFRLASHVGGRFSNSDHAGGRHGT